MIKSFQLKFGRAPGLPGDLIDATAVTVFVGPNNSGKSTVLAEIHERCVQRVPNANDVVLKKIAFDLANPERPEEQLQQKTLTPRPNESLIPGQILVGTGA
jgi:hypothetical protein